MGLRYLCLFVLTLAFMQNSFARTKRLQLHLHEMETGAFDEVINLKRLIRSQHPHVPLRTLELKQAILVAKSKMGFAKAKLIVSAEESRRKSVDGSMFDFDDPSLSTYDHVAFNNPAIDSRGAWQLETDGRMVIKGVIVHLGEIQNRPLDLPRGVSVNCEKDVGGNWLRPKTKFYCQVNGDGVAGYEIRANGKLTWKGDLDPYALNQSFDTDKQKVGGNSTNYEIYLVLDDGFKGIGQMFTSNNDYVSSSDRWEEDITDRPHRRVIIRDRPHRRPLRGNRLSRQFNADCIVDIGGNWLRPKTNFNCTITGAGAVSYSIEVNGSSKWVGSLDVNSLNNNFQTDKKRVGGNSQNYRVFVIAEDGSKHLVFRQLAN